MKILFRHLLITGAVFWALSTYTPLVTAEDTQSLLIFVVVLTLLNVIVKPVLKLVTLPLTIVTLGLFRGLLNLAILYFTIWAIPGVYLNEFYFPGWQQGGFSLPACHVPRIGTFLLVSFSLSLAFDLLGKLLD
ncbi:MAG: phage holin family protein [Patescibacteria group bacterium]